MGSQNGGDSNDKQSEFEYLTRQNSMYSLALDKVENQLIELGKPLGSMNLDELLKNVWTAEANQSMGMDADSFTKANQTSLQRQASVSLTSALSKKTVDEVWRDIQQSNNGGQKKSRERKPTLGEMTLEDFLEKAGVVAEATSDKKISGPVVGLDANVASHFPPQGQWMQYPTPQYQHPQQNMMGAYMPAQLVPQPLHVGAGAVMDVTYPDDQISLPSPIMGTLSDTPTSGRKRGNTEYIVEKNFERRHKRMIKNRESAARSRARKQAYTNELENKVLRLEEENERLRKRKDLENMLPSAPMPEPKYQLRRTSSAPL